MRIVLDGLAECQLQVPYASDSLCAIPTELAATELAVEFTWTAELRSFVILMKPTGGRPV